MPTIDIENVGGVFEAKAIEHDPFSEYEYQESVCEPQEVHQPQATIQPLQPKEDLFANIDMVFEGANFVFGIADHVMKHLQRRR